MSFKSFSVAHDASNKNAPKAAKKTSSGSAAAGSDKVANKSAPKAKS